MATKDKFPYELIVVLRFDDLETLPRLLAVMSERVLQIRADKLDEVGGEESGSHSFVAGWYDFNLRDRGQVADPLEVTKFPIRVNTDRLRAK